MLLGHPWASTEKHAVVSISYTMPAKIGMSKASINCIPWDIKV